MNIIDYPGAVQPNEKAVWGMLPKNRLGRAIIKKLHVYSADTHPHESQNPVELSFNIKKVADNE